MDIVSVLLRFLKKNHYVNENIGTLKKEVTTFQIKLRKGTDLFIRDAIMGVGTILEENLEEHYYIVSIKVGLFNNVLTHAIICRDGNNADVAIYAHEGLISQHLAEKAETKLRKCMC